MCWYITMFSVPDYPWSTVGSALIAYMIKFWTTKRNYGLRTGRIIWEYFIIIGEMYYEENNGEILKGGLFLVLSDLQKFWPAIWFVSMAYVTLNPALNVVLE